VTSSVGSRHPDVLDLFTFARLITSTVTPPKSAYGAFQGSAVSGRAVVLNAKFNF
jgi:hypothetical protein